MLRTLIFGAIAGYVGKKLYDEGKLTEFKDDIVKRYETAKSDIEAQKAMTSGPVATSTAPRPKSVSSY